MGKFIIKPDVNIGEVSTETKQEIIRKAAKTIGLEVELIADEYHTFRELYEYRKIYNALYFNELAKKKTAELKVYKSWKHADGELCFGGGWFIVVAMLPSGQVTNHYKAEDWDLFKIPEVEIPEDAWDGHAPEDVKNRLQEMITKY